MKHKFSINHLTLAVASLLLAAGLSSCSELMPSDGRYWVKSIDEGFKTSNYQLVQLKGFGQTWIRAERGLYHVGDTLVMGKPCR